MSSKILPIHMFLYALFLLGTFLPAWCSAGHKDEQPIAAEYLFEITHETGFTLSSDGKYLAFVISRPRDYVIGVTDIDKKEVIHQFSIGPDYPNNLRWINNRTLLFNQKGRLLVVDRDGTDFRVLIGYIYDTDEVKSINSYNKNLRSWQVIANLDPERILVQAYDIKERAYIHRVNVFTGEKEDLYDGNEYDVDFWATSLSGDVSLARRNKDEKYTFYSIDEKNKKLKPFNVGFDGQKFNLDFDGRTYLGNRVQLYGFSYDKSHIYLAENNTTGFFRLLELNIDAQTYKVILEDKNYDIGTRDNWAELLFDSVAKQLAGITYNADKMKTVWFDKTMEKYQNELDIKYPKQINRVIAWSDDKQRVLVRSLSDKSNGKIYIYDAPSKKVSVHTHFSPNINESQVGETKIVKYSAGDGYQIESYLTLPPKQKAENLPTVIMPHGGPFARDYFGYNPYVQYFASRGYAVLSPNFRGSTGYGRNHLMAGKNSLGNLMVDDIVDGTKWLVAQGISDKKKMHILGFSYGGYAALMSVIRYPDVFASAVSYGGPLDIFRQIKDYKKQENYFAYEYWKEMVAGSDINKKHLDAISPVSLVSQISKPILVMHGKNDPIVSVEQVEEFQKETKQNKNVEVVIMKDEEHGIDAVANKIYFAEKARRLFEKN